MNPFEYLEWLLECDFFLLTCAVINMIAAAIIYFPVFLAGCIVLMPLPPWKLTVYGSRLGKLILFFLLLVFVGACFAHLWFLLVYDHFYHSTDYCGTDFFPFHPITQGMIDSTFGNEPHGLMGVTLFQLNLIWFVFALGTYGTTVVVYRQVQKRCWAPPAAAAFS